MTAKTNPCRSAYPDTDTLGRIIAHRGASRMAPENTLSAFRSAAQQGARWLEFDVSLLGDGTPVLHHDDTLDRCTDRTGPLSALGIADLTAVDAGCWFGPDFSHEPLATLEQALDLILELGLSANLEMKPHNDAPELIARSVATSLHIRPWTQSRILVSSFDLCALAAMRAQMPHQPLAVLYEDPPTDWTEVLATLRASSLHIWYEHLSSDILAEAQGDGFHVRAYTINDPDHMARFRDLGLTGVITDHPPLFLNDIGWAAWAAAQAE